MTPTTSTPPLAATLEAFFTTKTAANVDGTMAYFAPDMTAYIDATLRWNFDSFASLEETFAQYMPDWKAPARSYATQILAGSHSALVRMVDTPELFGGELRILAAVDVDDHGKITRWVDYWDSTHFDTATYEQFQAPAGSVPPELTESMVPSRATGAVREAAQGLQRALGAGDVAAATALIHPDVTFTDMAQRTQLIGRIETARYLEVAIAIAPYGAGSSLRRVVGGGSGGGFEWTAGTGAAALPGITELQLDESGLITSIATVYDSRVTRAAG